MLDFGEIQKEFDGRLKGITSFRSMIKEYLQEFLAESLNGQNIQAEPDSDKKTEVPPSPVF